MKLFCVTYVDCWVLVFGDLYDALFPALVDLMLSILKLIEPGNKHIKLKYGST